MTQKDLLLDIYNDMKFVRPAVEAMQAEGLPVRVRIIENRHLAEDSARQERSRIGGLSNKALGILVLIGNFALAAVVVIAKL